VAARQRGILAKAVKVWRLPILPGKDPVLMTSAPQEHDCAVVLCCDRNFLPLSLFMIRQIAHYNPNRGFDLFVASNEGLELPDWARPYGIVLPRIGITDDLVEAARITGGTAALLRLTLARELGSRYRRILYLDSDMFVEGGDFTRLAPCWNWQTNARLPLVSLRYPAFVRHFIGPTKPNKVTTLHLDARFNQAYRDHLAMLDPDQLAKLAAPADPAPMRMTEVFRLGMKHMMARSVVAAAIRRHPDPYVALH
jgi:hypothetical protein